MRVLWIITLAACGRFGFDPRHDAMVDTRTIPACPTAVGHDEDGDGIDDACDGCPHVFTAVPADRDGDGVDDACDPEPDMARQRVAFFDAFAGGARPEWTFPNAQPTFVASGGRDSLSASTAAEFFMMRRAEAPARDVFAVGGRITAVRGTVDRQITIQPEAGAGPAYYCELLSSATSGKLAFTYTPDGNTYTSTAELPIQPVELGAFTLTMTHAPPDVICETSWPPQPELSASIPAGITAIQHAMFIDGIDFEIDYFVQIRTD